MRKEQSSGKIVDKGTENKILKNTEIDNYGFKVSLRDFLLIYFYLFFY